MHAVKTREGMVEWNIWTLLLYIWRKSIKLKTKETGKQARYKNAEIYFHFCDTNHKHKFCAKKKNLKIKSSYKTLLTKQKIFQFVGKYYFNTKGTVLCNITVLLENIITSGFEIYFAHPNDFHYYKMFKINDI